MIRIAASFLVIMLSVAQLYSQSIVTAAWDANTDGVTTGYILKYGTSSHQYTNSIDVPGINSTTTSVNGLVAGIKYYFAVLAYNAMGQQGPISNEVTFTPAIIVDPKCAYPLGQMAVVITPTRLIKTGNQQAGSLAEMYFIAQSINSPIISLSIRANGVDIPDSIMTGTNLKPSLGLRFTVPPNPATYTYSIFGTNQYGCSREQVTTFHF